MTLIQAMILVLRDLNVILAAYRGGSGNDLFSNSFLFDSGVEHHGREHWATWPLLAMCYPAINFNCNERNFYCAEDIYFEEFCLVT